MEEAQLEPINGGSTPITESPPDLWSLSSDGSEEDEKMDMLWEDFNEELLIKSLSSRFGSDKRLPKIEDGGGGGGGALLSARMASVVVIIKVLKKLLFLRSFRRKLKLKRSDMVNADCGINSDEIKNGFMV